MGAAADDGPRLGAKGANHLGRRGGPIGSGDCRGAAADAADRGALARALCRQATRRIGGRAAARGAAPDYGCASGAIDHRHARNEAGRRHALEYSDAREENRAESQHGGSDLARIRPAAASQRDVQAVARPVVCRKDARHRRPLSGPAGPCPRLERGREKPDSGPRSHGADPADDLRLARAADARLSPARHHVAVRSARRGHRQSHWRVSSAPSQPGVPAVPRDDRRERGARPRCPFDPRQLRHPQDARRPTLVRQASALSRPLHADERIVAQPRRTLVRAPE